MDSKTQNIFERTLQRERMARKAAEKLLEDKSKELYDALLHLKEANGRLESLLSKEGKNIEGAFVNLIDPYVVMDLTTKVISMNTSAKEFLGYDNEEEDVYLSQIVHPDYLEYTNESFTRLLHVGIIKNYNAKIVTRKYGEKYVNINASLIYNKNGTPIAAQGVIRDITSEMEVKRLVESQKKQLDLIVENSSLGIMLIVKGKIAKANDAFCQMLGYEEYELKKFSLEDVSTIADISQYQAMLEMDAKPNSDHITITRIFHKKNGGQLFGKTSITNVYNHNNEVEYNVVMVDDITSEKVANDKLAASESRMSTMIGNLQSGILLEDANRRLVMSNKRFTDFFDLEEKASDLKGKKSIELIDSLKEKHVDSDTFLKLIEQRVHKKEVAIADELELKDGRYFSRDYIPLFTEDELTGHLWVYTDITLQKHYRRNLEQQQEKYSNIIANMNLGLVEIDRNRNVLFVNNRFCDMVDQKEENIIGERVFDIVKVDQENTNLINQQLESRFKGESDSYQIKVSTQKGAKKYWLISGAPTYNDLGKVAGSIGVYLDVTEQHALEVQKEKLLRELEQSNQGLQEYAHIVSHDLKSPLRSVSALADWMLTDYKDKLDDNGVYNLKMIQEKIEGMDKLIGGILKYSMVNRNKLEEVKIDMNSLVKEISEIIYCPDNVKVKTAHPLPIIKADKTMMHQLFQNFLSNAVVHIDKPEGLVEVGCVDSNTHWQFSVKDNGVGIPKEYHQKIFQIFQSIGNRERSTGIGLSIVKKIIERYRGKVWLESEIGVGTTFYFTIIKDIDAI